MRDAPTPMADESSRPALLLVDVQQALDDPVWGPRNNPDLERHVALLLQEWRAAGAPVLHVQHLSTSPTSPLRPGTPGVAFKPEAAPIGGEPVFQKRVISTFIGTDLEDHLRKRGIRALVMAGLTTDHCVSTTVRMAANLGFEVAVVDDATATFDREGSGGVRHAAALVHEVTLASLRGEFAEVVSTAEALRWLTGSGWPASDEAPAVPSH